MNELRRVATGGGDTAAEALAEDEAVTRELVGWALQSPLRGVGVTSAVARGALATALGVPEVAIHSWTEAEVQSALARLSGLISYCERLASEAMIDEVTGALRRRAGEAELTREIDRARRTGDGGIVVGFLDLDGLKAVNDTEGHAAGDAFLRAVVRAVRERVRSYDILFRYGGDEFVCVLLGVTHEQAERTFAEICGRVSATSGGHTVSIGLAEAVQGDTADTVIERADAALYQGRAASTG
ncbi:MAG TPA: GGDEF domain-containing protein [Candidatus Dormibacteraeota bacterium]